MDKYCCKPKNCNKKGTCNHFVVENIFGKRIEEDLSDICLPGYRLYIEGDYFKNFPSKAYYVELFNFFDNICTGERCVKRKLYDKTELSSRIECKLGEQYTCCHPMHPHNKSIVETLKVIMAEEEAFKNAGIEEGTIHFTCPICGGEAVASRYKHNGRYHGLGSHCKKCGWSHT